jgi:hypothetical protein
MAGKKRGSVSKSLDVICGVVEEKLASMPAAEADAKRAEIHRIASRARRTVRGKPSKLAQTRGSRLSARVPA